MRDRPPLLPGLAFAGYRSFAEDLQPMFFSSPVTVLAGINNSGKSNVLRYVQDVLPQLGPHADGDEFSRSVPVLSGLDIPTGFAQPSPHRIAIPVRFEPMSDSDILEVNRSGVERLGDFKQMLLTLIGQDEWAWLEYQLEQTRVIPSPGQVRAVVEAIEAMRTAPGAWFTQGALEKSVEAGLDLPYNSAETAPLEELVAQVLMLLTPFETIPPVATVSASRRLEIGGSEDPNAPSDHGWMSGRGLVRRLAELQNPVAEHWVTKKAQWEAINRFVQTVLADSQARLNIPFGADSIQVETPRRVLPLAHLGSGIEQVIVLAAAATIQEQTLVCMEEPESNLHPVLQRKLVRYLRDETSNQYLIATHSAHFLDFDSATVYHLRLGDSGTTATEARTADSLVEVCNDLGYRPSDLMQTNCIIWVEGPSDRIYLRKWLKLRAKQLNEGIDYKIMFYGGSLLTHLTVNDEQDNRIVNEMVDGFINLRRLNRASVVVMDSDRTTPDAALKPAVERVRSEYETGTGSGHAWVTHGYTVENYIPPDVLQQALANVHPSRATNTITDDPYANPFADAGINKVAVARQAIDLLTADNYLTHDLGDRLDELVDFVKMANARAAVTDTQHDTSLLGP